MSKLRVYEVQFSYEHETAKRQDGGPARITSRVCVIAARPHRALDLVDARWPTADIHQVILRTSLHHEVIIDYEFESPQIRIQPEV